MLSELKMAEERWEGSGLFGDQSTSGVYTPGSVPDYNPTHQNQAGESTTNKLIQVAYVAVVIIMVAISLILSLVQAASGSQSAGLYIMLGLSLLGFVALEIFMIIFIRKGDLPREKNWFLYLVGACIILECIFTNVLLFL